MDTLIMLGVNAEGEEVVMNISPGEQPAFVLREHEKCLTEMVADKPWPNQGRAFCPRIWDDLLCWPDTLAGSTAEQPCPDYVQGFKIHENATFQCTDNGTWYFDDLRNRTWTNFSRCLSDTTPTDVNDIPMDMPHFAREHMARIQMIYNIGYGISLVSLLFSVIIMLAFKRLHCPRNTIHLNLFMSFILRASFSFMKENILVEGVGFASDVTTENGSLKYKSGPHWECKLFFTLFHYILAANYMWICVEALYLLLLIHKTMFTERSGIRWYIMFGWGSPFLFVIPWVIVKRIEENVYCWNIQIHDGYFWIMRGPIVATILINFVCFISIVRVLFTKLSAVHSPEANRYRKLAKSTLVLIPLFGVHYIIFAWYVRDNNHTIELIQLYYEMSFNSIQGFFVALLYCFLNGEVRSEMAKKWQRFRITHLHHFPKGRTNSNNGTLDTTVFSRPRESNASMSLSPEMREQFDHIGSPTDRRPSLENSFVPNNTKNSDSMINGRTLAISEREEEEVEPMICLKDMSARNGTGRTGD